MSVAPLQHRRPRCAARVSSDLARIHDDDRVWATSTIVRGRCVMTNPDLPLFRPAALAARRHDWRGRILLARPTSFAVLAALPAAAAGALAAFAYFGTY